MSTRQGYVGIDRFRLLAAILVVAVHTSPLLYLGIFPDFIFTRIFARLGVPFFFAATGFFLLGPYAEERRASPAPVLRFVRKTALLYGVAILLYLPVNLYAGHFTGVRTFGQALKLVLVDGTMYHLWYLPACILGAVLVWALLRFAGIKAATMVALGLYAIGLLGDSYYGFIQPVPWLNAIYQGIFQFADYTRNGLFYAPVFLLAGAWAAGWKAPPRKKAGVGLLMSLVLLLAEGLLLYTAGAQRHDSMYIVLPVCTFLLMTWLASFRGPSSRSIRTVSLLVYLLHPWVIVLLRGVAKPLGLTGLLVDNSLVHFVAVSALSFGVAWLLVQAAGHLPGGRRPKRSWMEVDMDALANNVQVLQGLLPPGSQLMPAVKGNAYGFGAVTMTKALYKLGVRHFCVATLAEGMELRRHGVRGDILVLGYTHPDDCRLLHRYHLAQTVVDAGHGAQLAATGVPLTVHLKVDTGRLPPLPPCWTC